MKISNVITLVGILLGSFNFAHAATEPKIVDADCFYTGGSWISKGGMVFGSTNFDKAFETEKGVIHLEAKQISKRGGFGDLKFTVWQKTQKVDLGYGYAVLIYLRYQTKMALGDSVVDSVSLKTSSILTFNDNPISAASVSAGAPQVNFKGAKFLRANVELDNLPLRVFLGAADTPEKDLMGLVRDSSDQAKIYTQFGNGDGVMTSASVTCDVVVP